ncbi:HD-GYP domain-containing protein [Gracilibacillus pellucidus]|uniref:HD-GYP domain-containing protein n=1 Tax=Gracilibacillus pellucidus TaxID=3095368 RepID=UPI0039B6F800
MRVHPEQLVPGCIITEQVLGRTRHPIIDENTVINEKHIHVLKHFQIPAVEVSNKLVSGSPFIPQHVNEQPIDTKPQNQRKHTTSFEALYLDAVASYKKMFTKWQGGSPVDIYQIRKIMTPLLEHLKNISLDLFLLHKFSSKRDYFYHHGIAISLLSAHLAKKIGYEKDWMQVGIAAILADCGMARVSENWLVKETKLTVEEYNEIKKHPTLSYRMIEDIPSVTKEMKLAVLQHHERIDGSGYPLGTQDEKIHPFAKIIAVSDTYHAMTSERIYRTRQSPFKVMEEMLRVKYQKYDYSILQKFIDTLMYYTIGTRVLLSNGKEAYIIFVDQNAPTRPTVRLMDNDEIVNLDEKRSIFIENIINN